MSLAIAAQESEDFVGAIWDFFDFIQGTMRRFRSLLIDRAAIRMPGLAVMQLALHRHLGEHATIQPHQHRWCQALLYLTGSGEQVMGDQRFGIVPGSLVVIRPGMPHAFARTASRSPLCLMIDFRLTGASRRACCVCALTKGELAQVREILTRLIKLEESSLEALRWQGATLVLDLLTRFLRAAGWFVVPESSGVRTPRQPLKRLLDGLDPAESLIGVIRRSGYQRDHLNRLIKSETGLSLGQHRTRARLARARRLLQEGLRVSEVATLIGLPDQGYFARWFRRQTGVTPSAWAQTTPGV
jgi:AraC family transcriptional regulator, transcriptional activator of pobA